MVNLCFEAEPDPAWNNNPLFAVARVQAGKPDSASISFGFFSG
jgi:hypothetical protein